MAFGENPYLATNPPLPGYRAEPAPAMDYTGAYGYIFQSPAWLPNLFFTLISTLIPFIGHIIVMGYQFEIVESLIRDPRRVYPDFDWNKFGQYLTRGVWPFLIALIVGIVLAPVLWVLAMAGMLVFATVAGNGNDASAVAVVVFLVGLFMFAILAMMILQLGILAFQIRAGLAQDFGQSFNFAWARDFVARIWVELLLSMLFIALTAWALTLLGALVFCVGMYVALAWVMLAQAHIYFQLYRLYLARGGQEIPLQPPPPPPPIPGLRV